MREKIAILIAWHLPRLIVYWCFIRVCGDKCLGNPAEQACKEAADRWMK